MATVKRHKAVLLLALSVGPLVLLLFLPTTWMVLALFARAAASSQFGPYVLVAPALLAFGLVFNSKLKALDCRWLEWSPFHNKANLALMPLGYRRLWLPYGLMLGCCMPLLALIEEVIFRSGTTNWIRGLLWGGLAFGLLHLLSLVSVRMVIYIGLLGLAFVQVYMLGGLLAVFVVHASYNLLVLSLLIIEAHSPRLGGPLRRLSASVHESQ